METVVIIGSEPLERAIASATNIEETDQAIGLNAPLDGAARGIESEIWDSIVDAARDAQVRGSEAVRAGAARLQKKVKELLQQAGTAAHDIIQKLRVRLQRLVRAYINEVLMMMNTVLEIGEKVLSIQSVQVQHKLVVGGDISLSIESALKLVSSGEMSIAATYEAPHAPTEQ